MSGNHRSRKSVLAVVASVALIVSFLTASLPAAHALVSPLATSSSFNSSFNGDHAGWSVVSGPWKDTATAITTPGSATSFVSSIKHAGNYTNFVYTVRMKRTGSFTNSPNWLWVHGNPLPLATGNFWDEGWIFGYDEAGDAVLGACLGGVCAAFGAPSPAVIAGPNYNVLKVWVYGPFYLFYINGTLEFAIFDASIPDGSVGIGMFRPPASTGNKLLVDYAKLTKITADPGPLPDVKWLTLADLRSGSSVYGLHSLQDVNSLFGLRAP